MTTTPNLDLPYLAAGQAQKHVTLNESLRMLDALLQLSVVSRSLAAPPATPAEGTRYLVPASPTGGWSGQAGKIAAFQDGGWAFYAPNQGWLAWVGDEGRLYAFDGTAWLPAGAGASQPMMGINATADVVNRLAVSSPATLLNHEGAGHQLKLNKASAGDTASILFQTGFSGRAEIGLAGDDNLSFKVSPDGASFYTGVVIDKNGGAIGIGGAAANSSRGPFAVLSAPGKAALFAQDSPAVLAAGGTLDFLNFSGLIMVFNTVLGGIGVFVVGGGNVVLVGSAGTGFGAFSFATAPNRYKFTNTEAATQTFQFLAISGRGAA